MAAMKMTVVKPGLFTTIQDLGRWGHQAIGMPVAGAMDWFALRVGNMIVGNPEDAAGLECTLSGPKLHFQGSGILAVAGADLQPRLNGEAAPMWRCFKVHDGDSLSFAGPVGKGCRSYICFGGGLDVPVVMGSRSTYVRAAVGGLHGRPLKPGDVLETGKEQPLVERTVGFAPSFEDIYAVEDVRTLSVIEGPQIHMFPRESFERFCAQIYEIGPNADRMGYRLEGPTIEHKAGADIVSDAIPPGSVQVPGHGKPIIMLADRQTTGGYAKIATVITADVPAAGRMGPGDKVSFKAVGLQEAVVRLKELARRLRDIRIQAADYRSRPRPVSSAPLKRPDKGSMIVTVEGEKHRVDWETL